MSSDPQGTKNAPMGDEQRAELEKRLKQVRAAQQQQQQQQQQPQPKQQQAPTTGYGYEDDCCYDDDEEDVDEGEEAFLDMVEEAIINSAPAPGSYQPSSTKIDMDVFTDRIVESQGATVSAAATTAVSSDAAASRRVVGDFELLRLAKMGDLTSVISFAQAVGDDVKTLMDNQGRNVLHYAADSGNMELLNRLKDWYVPYVTSEKGVTPLDVAVLRCHSAEVIDTLRDIAKRSKHADGEKDAVDSFEAVVARVAPEPPKFVMSRPVPSAPTTDRSRSFWKGTGEKLALPLTGVDAPASITVARSTQSAVEIQTVVRDICGSRGLTHWLPPLDPTADAALSARVCNITASDAAKPVGVVCGLRLGGSMCGLGGKAAGIRASGVALAGCLSTVEGSSNTMAATLMAALGSDLAQDCEAVCFTSQAMLPQPPVQTCVVKCFRRVLDPNAVVRKDGVSDVFPEFAEHDELLRADCVAKGTVLPALRQKHAASVEGWSLFDGSNEEQVALILQFLGMKAASAGAELMYLPETADDVRSLLNAAVKALVRTEKGAVVDIAVFRTVTDSTQVLVAEVVYAMFTSLKGTDKAEHLLIIAQEILKAQVLLVPSTFGFTDSDLAKANFDEMPSRREFLYVLRKNGESVSVVPAIIPSKVYIPIHFL